MEGLPDHSLPTLELDDIEEEPNPKDRALAKKVHEKLTDIRLQLVSLKSNRIRSLRALSSAADWYKTIAQMNRKYTLKTPSSMSVESNAWEKLKFLLNSRIRSSMRV